MPKRGTYIDQDGIVRLIPKKTKPKPEGALDLFDQPIVHTQDPETAREGAKYIEGTGRPRDTEKPSLRLSDGFQG